MLALLQHDQSILEVPKDALSSHHEAGVLGAPVEAGKMMYLDLQNMYKPTQWWQRCYQIIYFFKLLANVCKSYCHLQYHSRLFFFYLFSDNIHDCLYKHKYNIMGDGV